jgi:ribosomal protein S12 methylthiotransferase
MKNNRDKVKVITLGCPKNVVDSEVLLKQLQNNNLELSSDSEESDIAIINTCGFINDAKRESIDTILHAVQLKKERKLKKVIVMGCLSERYATDLLKEIPEIDACIGANKLDQVLSSLGLNFKYNLLGERLLTTPKHYAYLKISEGCDRPCSFCSIPIIRGQHISKPIDQVLIEAKNLAAAGVKELIIIAQDSTYYGLDLYGKRILATLLERLGEIDGIEWIRLMYAFPTGFPMDVLEQFNQNPKLCRYLDIPVQHISDSLLNSMRRGISSKELRKLIENIRLKVPEISLRTTVIVGYPNEGEKEFEELLQFVKETEFDRLGVFTYSQEEGTASFPLGDPIPQDIKEERLNIVMGAQHEIAFRKNQQLIGKTIRVFVDRMEGNAAIARTQSDAPEVDNDVTINDAKNFQTGNFYNIEVIDADAYDLFAEPVENHVSASVRIG